MDNNKICWYIYRLSKMSLEEIFWRLDVMVNQPDLRKIKRVGPELARNQLSRELPVLGERLKNDFSASGEEKEKIVFRAEKILRHEFDFFGESVSLPREISWLKDPLNGADTPRIDFLKLNYREMKNDASVMRVWFLNRHTHLVTLAQAYAVTGREEFAVEIVEELNGWLAECHYPYGLPWATSMEAAMRLLAWTFVYRFLGDKRPGCFNERFAQEFFTAVKQHFEHVKFNRSRFSSANNHALAELAALLCAKETFPLLFEEEKDDFAEELMNEAQKQFSDSGVNLEQAFSYHAFSLELLCAAASQSQAFLHKSREFFFKAAIFLNQAKDLMSLCGEYGDSDEAAATGIIPRDEDYYSSVAKLSYALSDPDPKKTETVSEDYQWYTGTESKPLIEEVFNDYSPHLPSLCTHGALLVA